MPAFGADAAGDGDLSLFELAGYIGVALYLGAYAALQLGVLRGSGLTYTLANLAAACLVLVSLIESFNRASAMIQLAWVAISLAGLARMALARMRLRFSAEERAFLAMQFPDMTPNMARRFLDAGNWIELGTGTLLTREGEPVTNLFCVVDGRIVITSGGQEIGEVTDGFVGEINVMSGGPATATAVVARTARLFVISGDVLRQELKRDPDLRLVVEHRLTRDTGEKLAAANRSLRKLRSGQ
ncbi:Crp/Fnr family transcriptional regulator [Litorisediminicola beolgyonensis]|uniref:Crp/Fnr family transcriptional regulator n=1 Tax=Litorisediminicola beolgyonensis TaxID=1173614 RepID=A0ABW3ZMD9_9RHOB